MNSQSAPIPASEWLRKTLVAFREGTLGAFLMASLAALTSLSSYIYPISGINKWLVWMMQPDGTIEEWLDSIDYKPIVSLAYKQSLVAFFKTLGEKILTELLKFRYGWCESWSLYQLEYFWRGLNGRHLPPPRLREFGKQLSPTTILHQDWLDWAPICHPVVEYSKPEGSWTPRMFAAKAVAQNLIPTTATFAIYSLFDLASFVIGRTTWVAFSTAIWRGYFDSIGALAGTAGTAAFWSVTSKGLLNRISSVWLRGLIDSHFVNTVGPLLGRTVVSLIFPFVWSFDDPAHDLPVFVDGAIIEKHRRETLYGKYDSRYPKPPQVPPPAPEDIDEELTSVYIKALRPFLAKQRELKQKRQERKERAQETRQGAKQLSDKEKSNQEQTQQSTEVVPAPMRRVPPAVKLKQDMMKVRRQLQLEAEKAKQAKAEQPEEESSEEEEEEESEEEAYEDDSYEESDEEDSYEESDEEDSYEESDDEYSGDEESDDEDGAETEDQSEEQDSNEEAEASGDEESQTS